MKRKETFGTFFQEHRLNLRLPLRRFCHENNFDPGNISKLERDKMSPPQSKEKLEEYAKALKIKKGSEEWILFLDLACAAKGKIPADICEDKELLNKLPLVFRTLRMEKVSSHKLDELIKKIHEA